MRLARTDGAPRSLALCANVGLLRRCFISLRRFFSSLRPCSGLWHCFERARLQPRRSESNGNGALAPEVRALTSKKVPGFASILALVFTAALLSAQTASNQKIFERAESALKAGDYAAAESGFRQVLKTDPRNVGVLGNLGVVYAHTHRYGRAINVYKRALALSPHDPGLLLNIGLAYLKQDDYAHALPYFRQLHTRSPENAQATNLLSTCLVFGGQPQQALDVLKPAVEQSPDPAALYLLGVAYARTGQVDAGKQVFARLLTSDSTHAQASYILGQGYYDSKLFEEAAQSFQDVLQADPKFPGAHRELGKVYVSMRKNAEAEKELRAAVEQDPKDAVAVYFLGGLLVQSERYADGVPFLEQARSLDPDSWATYLYLGKAKLKLHENADAVRYLQQASEMNHDEASIFYLLASALHASGREEEAREARRRVAELHTNSIEMDRRMHDAMVAGAR
jgi:tetratricopeptide (TPR) repeat protein